MRHRKSVSIASGPWLAVAALLSSACSSDGESSAGTCGPGYAGSQCDRCQSGFVRDGDGCVAGDCVHADDCNDGDPCNGEERCVANSCQSGTSVRCGPHGACSASDGACSCDVGWTGPMCMQCALGYVQADQACVKGTCASDTDCADDDPCNGLEVCSSDHTCLPGTVVDCGGRGACDQATGGCSCDPGYTGSTCTDCDVGYVSVEERCLLETCADSHECDDGKACNGTETCSVSKRCEPGTALVCGAHEHCEELDGTCSCDDGFERLGLICEAIECDVPQAPTFSVIHAGAMLTWSVPGGLPLSTGTSHDVDATAPNGWTDGSVLVLPTSNLPVSLKVFARIQDPRCAASDPFAFVYEVADTYPPAPGQTGSAAIAMDDPSIKRWATGWVDPVNFGSDVGDEWKHPDRALGPAEGTATDIVSLGGGGSIVLTFDPPIANGVGPDFAVFENSFNDTFLELAFVEVSSNGTDFVRFDSAYLGKEPLGPYGAHETSGIGSLAGKYRRGFGTPFDLRVFINRPEVRSGGVDLSAIRYVRVVDVVGNGSAIDSFGNTIYDPYPTIGSPGFDLDAVAALN